jgi:hypothetical protein
MCDTTLNCNVSLVTITAPGGVDLRYNQTDPCGFVQPGDGRCTSAFRDTCRDWVDDLEFESSFHGNNNYATMSWIGHIGFYNPNPPPQGSCHCAGKAADISKIQWNGVAFQACNGDHASGNRTVRRRYLAVDASIRRYFKWALDGWFDSDHHDHIHSSSHYTTPNIVLDKNARSDTVFVQAVCNNFNGAGLVIDGDWGPLTDAAFSDINSAWNFSVSKCNPFNSHSAYVNWLHRPIAAGFADIGAGSVNISDGCNFPPVGPAADERLASHAHSG